MLSRVFTTDDTTVYSTWHLEEGGIVSLLIPEMGEMRMSYDMAEKIGKDLIEKAEYGRWATIENKSSESDRQHTRNTG